ncbi:type II toxin-antitoxin system HipA family toxin [Azohydromonas aeria]|uniref:type II toxin-antitoxin system HipA family toxin n=1 Tax=Azohydromonas aeria TaxID=2590212 RepID=UPI0012F7E089|nr:HipA domain-containing protein [Azohydromonas aeria]
MFCDIALSGWALDAVQKRAGKVLPDWNIDPDEPWGWWERLIFAPADGFGALFVGDVQDKQRVEAALVEELSRVTKASLERIALGESSSGALGGERPKIAIHWEDDRNPGPVHPSILKFALPSERPDSVIAEATALSLAREMGLRVPEHRVTWWGGQPALCICRFDRGPRIDGPAFHCVSAATALDLVPGSQVEDPKQSYVRLRSKLKRPGDGLELFKRIVLNAVVGNTDDHPWNTSLRQVGLGDWELAPLYDVLPFFSRTGRPVFRMAITDRQERVGSISNLVSAGRLIGGLQEEMARQLIAEISSHVRDHWQTIFERHAQGQAEAAMEDWAPVFEFDGMA